MDLHAKSQFDLAADDLDMFITNFHRPGFVEPVFPGDGGACPAGTTCVCDKYSSTQGLCNC